VIDRLLNTFSYSALGNSSYTKLTSTHINKMEREFILNNIKVFSLICKAMRKMKTLNSCKSFRNLDIGDKLDIVTARLLLQGCLLTRH